MTYWASNVICSSCGDGILHSSTEECDDKNSIINDGCTSCKIDSKCYTNYKGISVCKCGDGVLDNDVLAGEACDDDNFDNSDGCSSTCFVENGYHCDQVSGVSFCQIESCGDGNIVGDEVCDDGNIKSNDGCSNSC